MKNYRHYLVFIFIGLVFACSNNNDDDRAPNRTPNLQTTGDSANDILSNDTFDKLEIEIAYVEGFRPTEATMTQFTDFLRQHTFKQEIGIRYLELESPNEDELTLTEVSNLEEDNRTAYNDGSTLAIYIYFADAPSDSDDSDEGLVTLGAVYRNTSMIIYEQTLRRLAVRSSVVSVTDIESATLNHEFGHLFGLVNLGSPPQSDHEDPDAANHCDVPGCLMRAELQFRRSASRSSVLHSPSEIKSICNVTGAMVLNMLQSASAKGNTVALDPQCIADLRANGGR